MATIIVKVLAEPHRGLPGVYRITVGDFSTTFRGTRRDLDAMLTNLRYQLAEMSWN
jgi:hypothetical protein